MSDLGYVPILAQLGDDFFGNREGAAERCPGGQLVGVPEDASRQSPCDWHRELPVVTLPPRERTA